MTTQQINELSYPSQCQLCDNKYTNGPWYNCLFCPDCKGKMMGVMSTLANQPKLNYEPDPWDQMPDPEVNPFKGLNEMAMTVFEGNAKKGFWDNERNVGETLMLVVTELAEALEAHRKAKRAPERWMGTEVDRQEFEDNYKDTFEDEIADAVIRLLDLCGGWSIDLDWHVNEKVKYNAGREKLHGKQY